MQARHPSAGRGPICIAVALLFAVLNSSAASYQPQQQVKVDIRIWGSPADGGLVKAWGEGFRKHHRDARVVASLHGPESALASLYCDVADIAFIGRELRIPTDNMAFQWVKLYRPTTVEIANAGFQASRPAAGLAAREVGHDVREARRRERRGPQLPSRSRGRRRGGSPDGQAARSARARVPALRALRRGPGRGGEGRRVRPARGPRGAEAAQGARLT